MKRTPQLLVALFLGVCFASHCEATVWYSDGTTANIQAINDNSAQDGDTIMLPAGTFSWGTVLNVTKGVTIQGQTTITGAGTASPTVNDATVILDNNPQISGPSSGIIKATVAANKAFRLTGVTFAAGARNTYGPWAVQVQSGGATPNTAIRIDNCHFSSLYQGYYVWALGWIYGVADHNVFDCLAAALSFLVWHDTWGDNSNGNGSWADFPYYGTEKFWFIEDNTIRGSGTVQTSGNIDVKNGGRYVARHNYFQNASPNSHGTEGGPQRGMRAREVYDNTFNWTIAHSGTLLRSGSDLWHDNTWTGTENGNDYLAVMDDYRLDGAIGDDLTFWGIANGNNPWDANDPDGLYESGTATGGSIGTNTATVSDSSKNWTPNQWAGYSVTNTTPNAACFNHGSYIISNTGTAITYFYYSSGDRGAPLVFNTGDTYQIYRVLVAVDQPGRGKGDLTCATACLHQWPNQQLEPCYAWNNMHAPTGHSLGFSDGGTTTELLNRDFFNLGLGFPPDSAPQSVQTAYAASINGLDYRGEFTYPHPLVSGDPPPSQTPTPTPAPTSTPTPTPTATPTATATPTPTPTATPSPTATPTPCLGTAPNFVGAKILNAQSMWRSAGFTTNVITNGPPGQKIRSQSLPPGYHGAPHGSALKERR